MKEFFFNDKKILIKSSKEFDHWDSQFERDLYDFCYEKLPPRGQYKPYIDVDKFIDDENGSYKFNLVKKLNSYGLQIDKSERPSKKCTNKDQFESQLIIGNRLIKKHPLLMGLFSNLSIKSYHAIENAKLILNLNVITHDDFKDILLTNKEIFEQTWTREQSSSERQSGNTVIGSISESLFAESFKPLMQDETFFKVNNNKVSSYGDFIIMCLPNNLWISVKSSNARERLLASGYSNDIIGIGFFKNPKEFSDLKIRNYQKVGFLALYLPDFPVDNKQLEDNTNTYQTYINSKSNKTKNQMPTNINGKLFIRPTSILFKDLKNLMEIKLLEKRTTTNF